MSNLETLQEIKKVWNPETAFGNTDLIKLMNSIKQPNDEGLFEIIGEPTVIRIERLNWECVDCGRNNEEDIQGFWESGMQVVRKCEYCRKAHLVEINL